MSFLCLKVEFCANSFSSLGIPLDIRSDYNKTDFGLKNQFSVLWGGGLQISLNFSQCAVYYTLYALSFYKYRVTTTV